MIKMYNFVINEGVLIRYNGYDADITIPDGVKRINNSAFSFCRGLKRVCLAKTVSEIMPGAFFNCPQFETLDLGESTSKVTGKIFMNCNAFSKIAVSPDNKAYSCIDNVLYDKSGKKLLMCPEGRSGTFEVPKGIKEIGENAFSGCGKLTKITLHEGIIRIGDSAFSGCKGLTEMELPRSAKKIGEKVFWCCTNLSNVTVAKLKPFKK